MLVYSTLVEVAVCPAAPLQSVGEVSVVDGHISAKTTGKS